MYAVIKVCQQSSAKDKLAGRHLGLLRSSAILRPCVLVLRHHQPSKFSSNSQERKYRGRMKVPGCVLDIEDALSADLREWSR